MCLSFISFPIDIYPSESCSFGRSTRFLRVCLSVQPCAFDKIKSPPTMSRFLLISILINFSFTSVLSAPPPMSTLEFDTVSSSTVLPMSNPKAKLLSHRRDDTITIHRRSQSFLPTTTGGVAFACANPDPSGPPGIIVYPLHNTTTTSSDNPQTIIPYTTAASIFASYLYSSHHLSNPSSPPTHTFLLSTGTAILGFMLGIGVVMTCRPIFRRWTRGQKKRSEVDGLG